MPHSSGRSGGDSLVLEKPAVGVLQKIPMATDCMVAFLVLRWRGPADRSPLVRTGP